MLALHIFQVFRSNGKDSQWLKKLIKANKINKIDNRNMIYSNAQKRCEITNLNLKHQRTDYMSGLIHEGRQKISM